MQWDISFSGFVVGVLVGLTGMGGALIMTPLMIFLFGVNPTLAIGTDLVYASITKMFGAWQHWRQKTVDWQVVRLLTTGSIPSALLGVLTMITLQRFYTDSVEMIIGKMLGATYVMVAGVMIWRLFSKPKERPAPLRPNRLKLILLGVFAGYIVGLTSVGSGTLFMVGLLLIYPIKSALLIGTDIVQAVMVTGVAGLMHFAVGNVDLLLVGQLLIGSIPGILIGSRLSLKLPEYALRLLIVTMVSLTGVKMLIN